MADHQRKLIRAAVVATLSTPVLAVYPTIAEDRVYSSRAKVILDLHGGPQAVPAILVYTKTDELIEDYGGGIQKRSMVMAVEALVEANADLDETLDDLALVIEKLVQADRKQTGTADDTVYQRTTLDLVAEGANIYGAAVLEFEVKYTFTLPQVGDVDEDFDSVHIGVDLDSDAPVLTGDADDLKLGSHYWLYSGEINGKTAQQVFTADASDVADFTDASQVVYYLDERLVIDLT